MAETSNTSEDRDVLLNQLADDFAARQRRGERPRLEDYCRRHPELADDIQSLFPALVELEQAKVDAGPELAVQEADTPAVTLLGDFQLLRVLGLGGMGVVYEAEQLSLGRRVALKLLPAEVFRDPIKKRRFEREAKAAAKLHHTNIVPVHGFGEHDGTPYYVMQLIPGLGLDAVIDELRRLPTGDRTADPHRPPPDEKAALSIALARSLLTEGGAGTDGWHAPAGDALSMTAAGGTTPNPAPLSRLDHGSSMSLSTSGIHLPGHSGTAVGSSSGKKTTYWESVARIGVQVAGALAYAHKQGILHRDIKPANLLLDLDGIVWVTDFGLAKAEDSDNLTHTGDLLGTLRYMPPEAFEGKSDARGDIYALGLTLFEMVALRPAYEERDRNVLVKQVTSGEPPRLRKLRKDAPRDLVTIVEKAIEKDPARRYQTAGALADDLQRFMDGRPITARRATELERLWMWARRRPAIAALVTALFLCLLAGSVVSNVFAARARAFARDAELREKDATAARDEAMQTRNTAARQAAGLLLDKGIEDARNGEPARALHLFVKALGALPPGDSEAVPLERTIRANLSAWAETVPALEHIWPGRLGFEDVTFSPDGDLIALAVGKDELQCFRTDTGRPNGPRFSVPVGEGAAMVFAPDGRSLWVASPGRNKVVEPGAVLRFDPASGRRIQAPIPSTSPVMRLAVTPDGRYLVGSVAELHPGDRGGEKDAHGTRKWRTASILVWEAATGRVVRPPVDVNAVSDYATANAWPDTYLSLSPDGKSVTAWVERGANRFEGLTFTVDGKEPATHQTLPAVGSGAPYRLHFEKHMLTGLVVKDGQLHRWSAAESGLLGPGTPSPFESMHYHPSADGRSVVSVIDGRVFDTGAWPPRPSGVRFPHPGWQRSVGGHLEQSSDGRFAATWIFQNNSDRRLWRFPRPHSRPAIPSAERARPPERPHDKYDGRFDARGASVALWWPPLPGRSHGFEDYKTHSVRLVDATTGAVRVTGIRHNALIREVAVSPDGRYFATGSFDSTARVWETVTGRPAGPPLPHTNYVATVAFSPDGTTLAAGDYGPEGRIRFWNWRTGTEARPPLRHDDIILSVSFSPDGCHLAAIKHEEWSKPAELLVWDIASGTAVIRKPYTGPPYMYRETVRFRPDGRAIAVRDVNGVLRLWEVPSGKPLGEQRPLDGYGVTRFSPDGRIIAAAANLGVRLLDGATLAPLLAGYLPHPDPITDVAFSPDGALLLTAHETGSAQLWDVATRKPVGPPAVLIGQILAAAFTPDGQTCLGVAADGTVRRWPVPTPFAERNLDRLADRVALMTGQRMDDNQGLDSVSADKWLDLRNALVGDGSTALVPPRPDADWHDARAADAEQDGDAFGAEWHLDRLAKLRPDDWTIPARHGGVLALAGRRDEAAAAYDQAARLVRSGRDLADWLRAAASDDEVCKRYDQGLWNLDRAVKLTPDDWVPYAARAALAGKAGHTDRDAADIDTAIRLGAEFTAIVQAAERVAARVTQPTDWTRVANLLKIAAKDPRLSVDDRYHLAVACLKIGDMAGYRAACTGIAGRLPPAGTPLTLNDTLAATWAFRAGPGATDDWPVSVSWVDQYLTHLAEREAADPSLKERIKPSRQWFLHLRGALLVRAGRPEEAAEALRDPTALHKLDNEFANWVFLALAEHRLGHADAAKEAAARARAALARSKPESAWDRAEFELLAGELDAALPPPGK